MFILQRAYPVDYAIALNSMVGSVGQKALDSSNGDEYVKLSTGWAKVRDGAGNPVAVPLTGSITVQNSAGTVTRSLTAANGVVSLAAADASIETFVQLIGDGERAVQTVPLLTLAQAAQRGHFD